MGKDWQIRGSTIYLLTLVSIVLGHTVPMFPLENIAPFIAIFFYFRLKNQGRLKSFDRWEIPLILLYTIGAFIIAVVGGLYVVSTIPWIKIILVGLAADLIASAMGAIPVFGDISSAILVFILALTVIGGMQGALLAMVLMVITLIPGPSFGANTMFLVIFKIISSLIFGWGVIA